MIAARQRDGRVDLHLAALVEVEDGVGGEGGIELETEVGHGDSNRHQDVVEAFTDRTAKVCAGPGRDAGITRNSCSSASVRCYDRTLT
ncbi:hypothetical protein Ade02nite_85760 [Paractinoplanes deccanensis]|uniref:Uncharacterized protein n=1 Tax=Paractinoplanes deccanensis TaxID=113561 RepID=A0ABQ3YJF4_9ACTN|nr:hypothetical protein Ade02nite_85760 [Actinoplanes deccanensis]